MQTCVAAAGGRVPVVANVGDCSTKLAVDHARRAAAAGADALALTPPYYYLNSQGELMDHFRAVRTAVDLPLLVYNIPQTVKTQFEVATVLSLAEEGTVVGMKDSQNDLDWDRTLIAGLRERDVPFRLFLGTRSLIDAGMLLGACGAIPGTANVTPAWSVAAYEAAARGDFATAAQWQERLLTALPLLSLVTGGSGNANSIGSKLLKVLGVIEHATMAAPLRSPSADQARAQGPGRDRARHHGRAPPLAKRRVIPDEQRVAEFVQAIELPGPWRASRPSAFRRAQDWETATTPQIVDQRRELRVLTPSTTKPTQKVLTAGS